MLIHAWDALVSDTEWRNWLAGHDFGQLAVNDPGNGAPTSSPPTSPSRAAPSWFTWPGKARRLHEIGEWKPRR
jgi:hypothetical protein